MSFLYPSERRSLGPLPVAVVAASALAVLVLGISAPSAHASWGFHKRIAVEEGLSGPSGLALDQAGNIFVGSLFDLVHKFDPTGRQLSPSPFGPESASGVAVNPVTGNVYVVNAAGQELDAFNPGSGTLEHSFPIPGTANFFETFTAVQIASDAHGNVYVPNATEAGNKIEVFNEAGGAPLGGVAAEVSGTASHALKRPEGVAIGPDGDVWVADTGNGRIERFEPNGTFVQEIPSPHVRSLAVDGVTGDVFASVQAEGIEPKVIEYSPAGLEIAKFAEGLLGKESGGPNGVVADSGREIVYVADGEENLIQRFVSWSVLTAPPSEMTETQGTLNGTVEVEAGTSVASCKFEYGTTTSYGASVPCTPSGPYATTTSVSATLSGLSPGADYHYRISATNGGGFTQVGEDRVLGPPVIASQSAEATVTTATLRAKLDPNQSRTRCTVQYVADAEYIHSAWARANSAPCEAEVGPESTEAPVEAAIGGLRAGTTYDYRFLATNSSGVAFGEDKTFSVFGVKAFSFEALGPTGEPVIQAGAHPYKLTDTFRLNTSTNRQGDILASDANAKDIVTELPPGLIGNPNAVPRCPPYDVAHADCSGASQVGMLEVETSNPGHVGETGEPNKETPVPIYNLAPPKGVAAQLGARFNGFVTVRIDSRVRTGGDYGVTAEVLDSSTDEGIVGAEATLWGVPADESHTPERDCPSPGHVNEETHCGDSEAPKPFLTNPTACTGARSAHMSADPWQDPGTFVGVSHEMPAITGCSRLDFKPSIVVQPTAAVAASPSGLHLELTVPQIENPSGLAEADLKDAVVTLPQGMTVNPASAGGLQACSPAQIELHDPEPAQCPEASKIGSVEIDTPLIDHPLVGGVYVAQQGNHGPSQGSNPFGSLLALYIAVDDPQTGVVVKLAGEVSADPLTGRLTTSFLNNPQLPFEDLKLDIFAGARAPLATPTVCGKYTTTTSLEPWSHQPNGGEAEGTPDAIPSSSFAVTSGPGGSACTDPLPFVPSLSAGSTGIQAAAFTQLVTTFSREDGNQNLAGVQVHLPEGLLGKLASVTPCGEPQASVGTCPPGSEIGHTTVSAGLGPDPVTIPGGRVFITGPYKGAPYGLSIAAPAKAGPFDLGTGPCDCVVVRARIDIDAHTSALTVTSDPLPTMLQGIPLQLKHVNVTVDRPGFTFNPTNCSQLQITGTITGEQGASAPVSVPFEVANCATLPFKPTFSAFTEGRTSRLNGASLRVNVTSGPGQANIAKAHVQLPLQLPSRLTTLQKACLDSVFEANPANCPEGSVVGTATALTPVLKNPLTGPAYLVSHGGAAFPDLEVVLQGEGITLILDGQTDIKHGITTSTFNSLPDAPVTSFDLVLPEGPHSALAAFGSLCSPTTTVRERKLISRRRHGRLVHVHTTVTRKVPATLSMPTVLTGQNGAVMKQTTKIAVSGCPTHSSARRAAHGARHRKGR